MAVSKLEHILWPTLTIGDSYESLDYYLDVVFRRRY
jgi:hypothetical protein